MLRSVVLIKSNRKMISIEHWENRDKIGHGIPPQAVKFPDFKTIGI
jgi:hypothetical protein